MPSAVTNSSTNVSLRNLLRRFFLKASLTWVLVLLEGLALVSMPVVIGWAIDGLMNDSMTGAYQLGGVCLFMLFVGAGRRFYDTRAYAKIYVTVASEVVEQERQQSSELSKTTARVNLFTEFITFLEKSIPGILQEFINMAGTLAILLMMDVDVFFACLIAVGITFAVYRLSERRIFRLNEGGNDELERQVDVLRSNKNGRIETHFKNLMHWNVKLSDQETVNFSLIWIVLASVLVFAVATMSSSGNATFGQIVAVVMYVFGFIESVMAYPLYYQQLIRLSEISTRLSGPAQAMEAC